MSDDDSATIEPGRVEALLFDLDGVLTRTAALHAKAWKQAFDGFLGRRGTDGGDHGSEDLSPFDVDTDYPAYVDGKPRYDGVQSFLASRGIELPRGSPDDDPGDDTVCAVGNRKNQLVLQILHDDGVETYPDAVALLRNGRKAGLRTAIVSSSKNCLEVITVAGIADLFDARLDGHAVEEGGLAGKPAPDTYLAAADKLDVPPARAVVLEDAVSGVEAGRAGDFGLVVGVDRVGADHAAQLREHGADIVSSALDRLLSPS
ncbi:MAG: beta-phosphoglucomutase family hydrolase [Acidimicrobiia bacterium]|nr:beta-phosphoglucomutase family hydrolase [Acidimicrobiia bacterium]